MTDQIVRLGPEYFPRSTSGVPIAGGSIFIGLPDTDPEIVGNQIQVSALQENGTTVPITQPILTSGGGVPLYNGAPVTLLVSESYSLKVLDAYDVQIYNIPSTATAINVEYVKDIFGLINISSPINDQTYIVLSFFDGLNKGGGGFHWDSTTNKNEANGITVIDPDNTGGFDGTIGTRDLFLSTQGTGAGSGCWLRPFSGMGHIDWSGVDGGGFVDDSPAFIAVEATGLKIVVESPESSYLLDTDVTTTTGSWDILPNVVFTGVGTFDMHRGFWVDDGNGANVNYITDRALVGGAVDQSGRKVILELPEEKTWVGNSANGFMTYFDSRSQMACWSTIGGIGIAAASRSSDNDRAEAATIGFASYVKGDRPIDSAIWAYYGHADKQRATSNAFCMELDMVNTSGTTIVNSPYSAAPQGVNAVLWLGSGGETVQSGETANPTSCAIGIVRTGGDFPTTHNKGMVFQAAALEGTDGLVPGDHGTAIEMAMGHDIVWRYGGQETHISGKITTEHNTGLEVSELCFSNNGLNIRDAAGDDFITFQSSTSIVLPGTDNVTDIGLSSRRIKRAHISRPAFYPDVSDIPTVNGQMTFEATSNTNIKISLKGTDGVVRSANLTLS